MAKYRIDIDGGKGGRDLIDADSVYQALDLAKKWARRSKRPNQDKVLIRAWCAETQDYSKARHRAKYALAISPGVFKECTTSITVSRRRFIS